MYGNETKCAEKYGMQEPRNTLGNPPKAQQAMNLRLEEVYIMAAALNERLASLSGRIDPRPSDVKQGCPTPPSFIQMPLALRAELETAHRQLNEISNLLFDN